MNTPINFEQLWEVVTSGKNGYLVINPKTGRSSITQNTRKRHIDGRVIGDPLAPYIFNYRIEDLITLWSSSRNITEFSWQVNHFSFRANKPETAGQWARLFNYKALGQWRSHGLPSIYDILSDYKHDDIDGYYEIDLKMLTKLGDQAYVLIGMLWEKMHYDSMAEVVFMKPEGTEVRAIGQNHESIEAFEVPDRFRPMIEAFTTVLTI